MRFNLWLRLFLMAAIASFGVKALAHARLKTAGGIVPRSTNAGIKIGPCGGVARLANPAVFPPGATITVEWEETINHPGRFEFFFSPAGDANFQMLKSVPDNQNGTNDLPHQYSTTLTLPNTPCTDCTLQMIQVMTENPAAPSLYYSCADIRLQAGATMPTPMPPTTQPPPTTGPTPSCKGEH